MKKNCRIRLNFNNIGVILLVISLLVIFTNNAVDNYRLKKNGRCTWAYVFKHKQIGNKGIIKTVYCFNINNNRIEGSSTSTKDAMLAIGDSIRIIYLPSNPNINKSNSFLKKYCIDL